MTDEQGYSAAAEVGAIRTKRTWSQRAWIELKKAPLTAWFGLIVIAFYLFVAIFADVLAPYAED
ncbi:MAG: ABC transporter permease, partial [Pseudomonadota bacterium]